MIQGKYYEEFQVGQKFPTPGKTITESMITLAVGIGGFILPFFQDAEYAKKTIFKGVVAPAHLTILVVGGLAEQTGLFQETVVALLEMKARFTAPVRAGDTIRAEIEVMDKKETSHPEVGLIILKYDVRNQREEAVTGIEVTCLIKRRVVGRS